MFSFRRRGRSGCQNRRVNVHSEGTWVGDTDIRYKVAPERDQATFFLNLLNGGVALVASVRDERPVAPYITQELGRRPHNGYAGSEIIDIGAFYDMDVCEVRIFVAYAHDKLCERRDWVRHPHS